MSYLALKRYSTTTRHAAATITSGSGNFANDGAGFAILEASGATWVTNNVRKGDYVMVGGTREVSRIAAAAATSVTGGEGIKFFNGDGSTAYVLWFTKDGAGAAPTVTTETLIGPVDVLTGQTAATIGGNIRTFLSGLLTTTNFGNDFLTIGNSGANCDITCLKPGNPTNIALFAGTLTGWTFSTPTAGVNLTSTNQGIYRVMKVISNTMLLLHTNWPNPGVAVDGSATVFIPANIAYIKDETAVTIDQLWSNINDETIVDKLSIGVVNVNYPFTTYVLRLLAVVFDFSSANTCEFTAEEAIIMGSPGTTALGDVTTFQISSGNVGYVNLNFGRFGTNNDEISRGCHLSSIGFDLNDSGTYKIAHTSVMNRTIGGVWEGVDNKVSGMLLGMSMPIFGNLNGIETFRNSILATRQTSGLAFFAAIAESDNIHIGQTAAAGNLLNAGDFTITGLSLSDSTFSPVFSLAGNSNPTVQDPFEAYTIAELFGGTNGIGSLVYTFNPRFVFRDEGTRAPTPIENLSVKLTQITVTRSGSVGTGDATSTYRVTINGVNCDAVGNADIDVVAANIAAAINASAAPASAVSSSEFFYIQPDDLESDLDISYSVIGGTGTLQVDAQDETSLGQELTDANGRITIDPLLRAELNFGIQYYFKYNILVEGQPIRSRRYYFVPRGVFDDDVVFDVQQFDLEGELGI